MKLNIDSGWYSFEINGEVSPEQTKVVLEEGINNVVFRKGLPKARAFTGAKAKLEESKPYDGAKALLAKAALETELAKYGTWTVSVSAADRGAGVLKAQLERYEAAVKAFERFQSARKMQIDGAPLSELQARSVAGYDGPLSGPVPPSATAQANVPAPQPTAAQTIASQEASTTEAPDPEAEAEAEASA